MHVPRGRADGWAILAMMIAGLTSGCVDKSEPPRRIVGADPTRGLAVIDRVGCGACHRVPGLDWPQGTVGAPLDGFAERPLIAGRFPNQPAVLIAWLRDAPSLSPETGMPAMPISEAEARDVAAYLYTLDAD